MMISGIGADFPG